MFIRTCLTVAGATVRRREGAAIRPVTPLGPRMLHPATATGLAGTPRDMTPHLLRPAATPRPAAATSLLYTPRPAIGGCYLAAIQLVHGILRFL